MNVWGLLLVALGFVSRRRRPFALAAVLVALLAGPLVTTGSFELAAVNAGVLAWVGFLALRMAGSGVGNRKGQTTRRRNG